MATLALLTSTSLTFPIIDSSPFISSGHLVIPKDEDPITALVRRAGDANNTKWLVLLLFTILIKNFMLVDRDLCANSGPHFFKPLHHPYVPPRLPASTPLAICTSKWSIAQFRECARLAKIDHLLDEDEVEEISQVIAQNRVPLHSTISQSINSEEEQKSYEAYVKDLHLERFTDAQMFPDHLKDKGKKLIETCQAKFDEVRGPKTVQREVGNTATDAKGESRVEA